MRYSLSDIEAVRERLRALPREDPASTKVSKQEAVRRLLRDIKKARQTKNCSFEKLAEELTKSGLVINPGTLKSYVNRANGKRPQATKAASESGVGAPTGAPKPRKESTRVATALPHQQHGGKPPGGQPAPDETPKGSFVAREDSRDI